MDLTDQYLQYLRDTKQYDKLDRHYAGYPEEEENAPQSFMDAISKHMEFDDEPERDENWLNDGDNPYDFDNDKDTTPRTAKPIEDTARKIAAERSSKKYGVVRVFNYPNVPEGKIVIRFCEPCDYMYNFEYPDKFEVTDELRDALNNATNGDFKEVTNNTFIIPEEAWDNVFSKQWNVSWDYAEDCLAGDDGEIDIRYEARIPDGEEYEDLRDGDEWDDTIVTDDDIAKMQDDDKIWVWIWDGSLENGELTDYTPEWLYEWMNKFFSDYDEVMESLFEITVADYKRLEQYMTNKHKNSQNTNKQQSSKSTQTKDDEEREYDDDPHRYGGSNTRWNAHMPIKTQQLQAPKGGREHLKAIFDDVTLAEFVLDDDFDARHPGLPSNKMARQDMDNRITWSAENANPEDRYGTTKTGIDYISVGVGLDYGLGFDVFLYWDGQNIRAYIPWRGNCLDTINKCMLCGDDDNTEYFETYLGLGDDEDYEDAVDDLSDEDTNYDMCLEEFEAQFDPSVAVASENQQPQTNTSKQPKYGPKEITYDYLMDVHKNQKSRVYFKWNEHLQPSNTKLSAPKGGADHLEFLKNDTAAYWFVNVRDTKELKNYHGLSNINFPSNAKVREDIESFLKHYDSEDGDVKETGTTSNDIDYVAMEFSAGNNPSFYVFLYWDGNDVRAYVPYKGNCIDTIEQRTFDGDESVEYVVKYLYPQIPEYIPGRTLTPDEEYEVYNFIAEAYYEDDMEPDYQTCYKDFESKFGSPAPQQSQPNGSNKNNVTTRNVNIVSSANVVENVALVHVFNYPGIPAGKTVIQTFNLEGYDDESSVLVMFMDALDNSQTMDLTNVHVNPKFKNLLTTYLQGIQEIKPNTFVIDEQLWQAFSNKYPHLSWNAKYDFLADDKGISKLCYQAVDEDDPTEEMPDDYIQSLNNNDKICVCVWDGNLPDFDDHGPGWVMNWLDNTVGDNGLDMERIYTMTVAQYKKLTSVKSTNDFVIRQEMPRNF